MSDLQFDRGYVNAEKAAAGRFGGGGPSLPVAGEEGEFGFDDFLDVINPLQHIPLVSTLYREITGDEISAPARILGGTLFGGPTGFVSAIANTLFDEIAGDDIGASALALFNGENDEEPQVAQSGGSPLTAAETEALAAVPLMTASGTLLPSAAASPAAFAPAGAPPAAILPQARAPDDKPPQGQVPAARLSAADQPPRGDGGLLTGQDALNALFNDLHGTAAPSPVVAQQTPGQSSQHSATALRNAVRPSNGDPEPTERQQSAAPSRPPAGDAASASLVLANQAPDPVNNAALADQMLMALDKYRAMAQQRQQAGPEERFGAIGDFDPPTPQ